MGDTLDILVVSKGDIRLNEVPVGAVNTDQLNLLTLFANDIAGNRPNTMLIRDILLSLNWIPGEYDQDEYDVAYDRLKTAMESLKLRLRGKAGQDTLPIWQFKTYGYSLADGVTIRLQDT